PDVPTVVRITLMDFSLCRAEAASADADVNATGNDFDDCGKLSDLSFADRRQAVPASDMRDERLDLQIREIDAEAGPGTTAEGHERIRSLVLFAGRREAVWVKDRRVFETRRQAVSSRHGKKKRCSGWHRVSTKLESGHGSAREEHDRRMKPPG